MNANETVKALRCSGNENAQCKTCKYAVPYKDLVGLEGHLDYCDDDDLQRDAADLIESLQAELAASRRREKAASSFIAKNCPQCEPVEGGIPYCSNYNIACDGCEHIWRGPQEAGKEVEA